MQDDEIEVMAVEMQKLSVKTSHWARKSRVAQEKTHRGLFCKTRQKLTLTENSASMAKLNGCGDQK